MDESGRGSSAGQWDEYADRLRQQLPAAPEPLLDAYVTWAPWVAIVFGVLGGLILALLLVVTLIAGTLFSPFLVFFGAGALMAGGELFLAMILAIVTGVLEVIGGALMLRRSLTGWWLLALGLIVSLLTGLLRGSAFGLVLTLLIAYIHLQVKPRYH